MGRSNDRVGCAIVATPSSTRSGADRCPGLLAPFVASDGAMVRLRIPGGRVDVGLLAAVSALAGRFGVADITLTSRGSLQLRGLPDPLPQELITAIGDLGLVPSGPHDKSRNVIADPAAGLDDLVTDLDAALLADPGLAGLPGRFLFAVAGPGGPVLAEPWDIAIVDEGGRSRVLVDDQSVVVSRQDAVATALAAARRFLAARSDVRIWNVRDLPASDRAGLLTGGTPFVPSPAAPPAPGPVGDDLLVLVPLGLLTPTMVGALPAGPVVVTPWRSILLPGGSAHADALAQAGFVTTSDSPWTVLTACAGAPFCSRTTTQTVRIAREAAPFVDVDGPPVHVIGCERSCGHPARPHTIALNPTTAADVVAAQRTSPEKDR